MDFDTQDIALELVFQAVLYADYRQTRVIAENPDKWIETNPILGDHPSKQRVRNYFIGAAIAHTGITALLPQGPYRTLWQVLSIGWEAGMVSANYRIGIKF